MGANVLVEFENVIFNGGIFFTIGGKKLFWDQEKQLFWELYGYPVCLRCTIAVSHVECAIKSHNSSLKVDFLFQNFLVITV